MENLSYIMKELNICKNINFRSQYIINLWQTSNYKNKNENKNWKQKFKCIDSDFYCFEFLRIEFLVFNSNHGQIKIHMTLLNRSYILKKFGLLFHYRNGIKLWTQKCLEQLHLREFLNKLHHDFFSEDNASGQ